MTNPPIPQTIATIHKRCLYSLADFTRQQQLPKIADVRVRPQYSEEALSFPCVVWTYEGGQEKPADSQCWETVDAWYPCRCYVCHRVETGNDALAETVIGWRATLIAALMHLQTLENVPECGDLQIEYGVVIDPKLPQYQTVIGAFTVQCLCRYVKAAEDNVVQNGPSLQ